MAYESVMLGLFSIWQGPSNEECDRRGIPKRNQVFLGFSRDGFHWSRPDRHPFIGVCQQKNAWNWGNVQSVGGCCLIVGDRLYFYASGRATEDQGGLGTTGLATLRRDGFASMDAEETQGTLTTRPLEFSGKYLFVNCNSSKGKLRVEVLDRDGKVLDPFTLDNCVPLRDDSTCLQVRWKGDADLSSVADKPVRFRFHLKKGSLYSFWVSTDRSGASHGYVAGGGPGFTGPRDNGSGKDQKTP